MKYAAFLSLALSSCANPAATPPASPPARPAPTANSAEDAWLDADRHDQYTADGLTVEVVGVRVGRVEVESIGGRTESENEHLAVRVRLTNSDPNRKPEYKTWGQRNFDLTAKPKLSDEYGNKYKAVGFGAAANVIGSVDRSASVYPGKPVEDVLVFEKPLASAKELRLELPAGNVGLPGVIRFRITPPR